MIEKYLDQLNNFFKKYGTLLKFKKNDFIYKENDKNIYFLEEGEAIGIAKGKTIFYIKSKDISGEKSFLEDKPKPLRLKVISPSATVYVISQDKFKNIEDNEKIIFLKTLTLYISERVFKLDLVLSNIKSISKTILSDKLEISKILSIFGNIKNLSIFEKNEDLIFVNGNIPPNIEILEFVNQKIDQDIRIGKNYIIFKTNKYVYLLLGDILKNSYILSNTILYSKGLFEYIGDKIKKEKEKKINNLLIY